MGTLVFVCPTDGQQVSSGIELDRASFKSLPRTTTEILCPRCREKHLLSLLWLGSIATRRKAKAIRLAQCA
jgi:hypothetical protein